MTRDAGPRVAAILGQLRPAVDEIVVAADARVDDEDLAWYASVADTVHRVEYRWIERHLPWLYEQCTGDWVLRLDGDEVVGPDFVAALPKLAGDRLVNQYWFRRRWLFPDGDHWLDEAPWGADFQCRLARRNGLLRFAGDQHSGIAGTPAACYLDLPFYHLVCAVTSPAERASKGLRYEVTRPHLYAHGGPINDRFYFPERHARLDPAPVPDRDRAAIRAALEPARGSPAPAPKARVVPLAELDRLWPGRRIRPTAYAATITPLEHRHQMYPGEQRQLFFQVRNDGDTPWHWDEQLPPLIRLGYRWFDRGGACLVPEGPRTPFPSIIQPGATAIVPLWVLAPETTGSLVLEVDLVHELVRWFETPVRVDVEVLGAETTQRGPRNRALAPARNGSRVEIPRIVHRVWLGGELPHRFRHYGDTWRKHHPGWRQRLWNDDDLVSLVPEEAIMRCRSDAERSDLLRYEILRRFGGIYVDTDVECLRPFDDLIRGVVAFAGYEQPGRAGTAVLGCIPGHPAFEEAAAEARETVGLGAHSADATGPYFFSLIAERHSDVTLYEQATFYPFLWDEQPPRNAVFPRSYAVHHWALSWAPELAVARKANAAGESA
jgi:hypothetical protein